VARPNRRSQHRFQPSADFPEDRRLLAITVDEFAIASRAASVVAGFDGAIWFTQDDDRLGRMSTTGELTSYDVGTTLGRGLAATSNGDIWFTSTGYQIGRFRPGAGAVLFDLPHDASSSSPWRLAAGPDDNLWYTDGPCDRIGRLKPSGEVPEFDLPTEHADPTVICAAPDGTIWFTESGVCAIGRMTPTGRIDEFAAPHGALPRWTQSDNIVAGRDQNVWFADGHGNIGRVTTEGQITEFTPRPPARGQPSAICAGPDGNIWLYLTRPSARHLGIAGN
jgi:virginiamycin B lyase